MTPPDPRLAKLFEPVSIGSLTLPNRIVMAPMGRLGSTDGVLGATYEAYYRRRAEGGTALVISEATAIDDPMSAGYPQASSFFGEAALDAWTTVVDAVHAGGGFFAPQLWHAGIARSDTAPNAGSGARSPSGLTVEQGSGTVPAPAMFARPMSESDVADVVAAYARSSVHAQAIGCDAIEIHGAHGYLLDQFLWTATNQRGDGYNGDIAARARFSREVVAAIKAAGVTIPVIFRFSQWKMQDYDARIFESPAELEGFLGAIADAGADAVHVSTRRFWLPEFAGSDRSLPAWTKHFLGNLPVIAVGSIGVDSSFTGEDASRARGPGDAGWPANLDRLLIAMERGDFDMVALGRTLLSNPAWANLVREGRFDALRPYDPADAAVIV